MATREGREWKKSKTENICVVSSHIELPRSTIREHCVVAGIEYQNTFIICLFTLPSTSSQTSLLL